MSNKDPPIPWAQIAEEVAKMLDVSSISIERFCRRNGLSVSFYHKMQAQQLGPQEMQVGTAVRITLQAERRWQKECEQRRKEARAAAREESVKTTGNGAKTDMQKKIVDRAVAAGKRPRDELSSTKRKTKRRN